MATQTHQPGRPRPYCCCLPSRCSEVDRDRATHPHRLDMHRSFHLDHGRSGATSKGTVVTVLMVRSCPIDVVESTSSNQKVLTNAREHCSIHSLERDAFTHWMIEQFVKQATDRPLARLTNGVGKGGRYE